jgi:hypothetical protein
MSDDIESSQAVGATNLMRDIVMLCGVDEESRAYLCPHGSRIYTGSQSTNLPGSGIQIRDILQSSLEKFESSVERGKVREDRRNR